MLWLVITVSGGMMQQPVADCPAVARSLKLPPTAQVICTNEAGAVKLIQRNGCVLVRHTDTGADWFRCNKG